MRRFGHGQAAVLVRVAHVPVGHYERHGVEHPGRLARVGHRLVRKVRCPLDYGEARRDFR